MIEILFSQPLLFFLIFPALLFSIVLHEFAHCWVTDQLGDPTPRMKGRLTLNPLAHLDPIGTVAMLLTRFGWGKPAPFDPQNLKDPVRDSALIAAAGPVTNLVIAILAAVILKFDFAASYLAVFLFYLISLNISLAVFNLLPVGPLDGAKIAVALLPRETAIEFESFMDRFGSLVLIGLIFPWSGGVSPLQSLISPVISVILRFFVGIGG